MIINRLGEYKSCCKDLSTGSLRAQVSLAGCLSAPQDSVVDTSFPMQHSLQKYCTST
jgi:hypothetical protein